MFRGGADIVYVARSANEAGIDTATGCYPQGPQWYCRFRFSITLSQEAAQQQADATKGLSVVFDPASGRSADYLSEKLEIYLDDVKVDELNIGSDLKGQAVTQIQITGPGVGASQQDAISNSLQNMKRLQTILITGSLPVKLNIVKTDAIIFSKLTIFDRTTRFFRKSCNTFGCSRYRLEVQENAYCDTDSYYNAFRSHHTSWSCRIHRLEH